jgi:hypothetical protein
MRCCGAPRSLRSPACRVETYLDARCPGRDHLRRRSHRPQPAASPGGAVLPLEGGLQPARGLSPASNQIRRGARTSRFATWHTLSRLPRRDLSRHPWGRRARLRRVSRPGQLLDDLCFSKRPKLDPRPENGFRDEPTQTPNGLVDRCDQKNRIGVSVECRCGDGQHARKLSRLRSGTACYLIDI